MTIKNKIASLQGLDYNTGKSIHLQFEGAYISEIRECKSNDNRNIYIAPGLYDNQVNGFYNVDFSGEGLSVEKVMAATEALWSVGVTSYLPTLVTSPMYLLHENLTCLAKTLEYKEFAWCIPGFHLEGPYISPEYGCRGAHPPQFIRKPDVDEFASLNKASNQNIIQLSLAPECNGAFDLINYAVENNIVVGLAHHNASLITIQNAVKAGARISIHLGNGSPKADNLHHHVIWPQLADDNLWASVIADGIHLSKEELNVFSRTKGAQRLILTSDVTRLAGMPPGEYDKNGARIVLDEHGVIYMPGQNKLAGAAIPLIKGVENIMDYTGCSLKTAFQMSSLNPAMLYGCNDRGAIAPNKRADLIVFTFENGKIDILQTIVAGSVVYEK